MKHIDESVSRNFFNSIQSRELLHGGVIPGKSMIKVYCSESGILTTSLLSFVHDFCVNNDLLYYVTSSDEDGRVYIVLHLL